MDNIKLFDFQINVSNFIVNRLKMYSSVLDCSVVGSGKTFIAIDALVKLNLPYIIICPKIVIPQWEKMIELYDKNKNNIIVTNYEKIKFGNFKYYKDEWILPNNTIVVFDEAHKLKGYNTLNSQLLLNLNLSKYKVYLISATIADNPLSFVNVAKMLKITNNEYIFLREYGCVKKFKNKGWKFDGNIEFLFKLHNIIFGEDKSYLKINHPGIRITYDDIKKNMPEQIISLYYIYDHYNKINLLYNELENDENIDNDIVDNNIVNINDEKNILLLLNNFCKKLLETENSISKDLKEIELLIKKLPLLVRRTRYKQLIEIIKVKLLIPLIEDFYNNNYSIVIILNYTCSIDLLYKLLLKNNYNNIDKITGSTKNKDDIITNFQSDNLRILILNIKAAGIGISLHDINGIYKRISLISPSENIYELQQALGRIYRTGCKTNVIQYIVTVKNTIEESVHFLYKSKLKNMNIILDGNE